MMLDTVMISLVKSTSSRTPKRFYLVKKNGKKWYSIQYLIKTALRCMLSELLR